MVTDLFTSANKTLSVNTSHSFLKPAKVFECVDLGETASARLLLEPKPKEEPASGKLR